VAGLISRAMMDQSLIRFSSCATKAPAPALGSHTASSLLGEMCFVHRSTHNLVEVAEV